MCLGAPMLPSSRKHSLSLPPVPRHTPLGGLGLGLGLGLDDVDMSAYQNMAASLQAQTEAHQVRVLIELTAISFITCTHIHVFFSIHDIRPCVYSPCHSWTFIFVFHDINITSTPIHISSEKRRILNLLLEICRPQMQNETFQRKKKITLKVRLSLTLKLRDNELRSFIFNYSIILFIMSEVIFYE